MTTQPDFLTVAQAAQRLGVKPARVRQLLGEGRIPGAVKFGRDWAVPQSGLAAVAGRRTGRPRKAQ